MDKLTFMKRCFLWTGIIGMSIAFLLALIVVVICGHVIEESMFAEFAKWIVMGAVVTCILEVFMYVIGQLIYDFHIRKRDEDPE